MTEIKKKKYTGQQGELMRALNIDSDDIRANDAGYVSDNQRVTVVKRQRYEILPFTIIALVFGLLPVLFAVITYLTGEQNPELMIV